MKTKQLRYSTLVGAMIASLSVAGAVWAATDTTTFNVTATVNDACSVAATDLAFGVYDPNSLTDNLATSTVTATCTLGTGYSIGLDVGGNAASASGTTRAMASGGSNFLSYELYSDTTRTTVWTDLAGANPVTGTGTGLGEPHVVYGSITNGQNVASGSYTDTINVTIEF